MGGVVCCGREETTCQVIQDTARLSLPSACMHACTAHTKCQFEECVCPAPAHTFAYTHSHTPSTCIRSHRQERRRALPLPLPRMHHRGHHPNHIYTTQPITACMARTNHLMHANAPIGKNAAPSPLSFLECTTEATTPMRRRTARGTRSCVGGRASQRPLSPVRVCERG